MDAVSFDWDTFTVGEYDPSEDYQVGEGYNPFDQEIVPQDRSDLEEEYSTDSLEFSYPVDSSDDSFLNDYLHPTESTVTDFFSDYADLDSFPDVYSGGSVGSGNSVSSGDASSDDHQTDSSSVIIHGNNASTELSSDSSSFTSSGSDEPYVYSKVSFSRYSNFGSLYAYQGNKGAKLVYSDVPIYYGGSAINVEPDYSASISLTGNNEDTLTYSFSNNSDESSSVSKVYDIEGGLQGYDYKHFSGSVDAGDSYTLDIDIKDLEDYFSDKDLDYASQTAYLTISYDGEEVETITFSLDGSDGDSSGMFSEKKEYYDFPDIEDYLTDFPDFPEWDEDHPIESIWNIVKWVGECVIVIIKNLWGLLRWLADSAVVLVKNFGVLVYNLLVDLRKLFIYLFVPNSSTVSKIFSEKFPIVDQIKHIYSSLDYGFKTISFTFMGQDVCFDMSIFPGYFTSACYSFSTSAFLALTASKLFDIVIRITGIQVVDSTDSSGGSDD